MEKAGAQGGIRRAALRSRPARSAATRDRESRDSRFRRRKGRVQDRAVVRCARVLPATEEGQAALSRRVPDARMGRHAVVRQGADDGDAVELFISDEYLGLELEKLCFVII